MRQRMRIDERAGQTIPAKKSPEREERDNVSERVRVTLTFDRVQLAQVDQVAAQAGITRSALINLCVTLGLPMMMRTLSASERQLPEAEQGE